MRYNGNNLQEVLDAHKRWLEETDGWTEDDKANLIGADLIDANLIGADLIDANLRGANLIDADLRGANLRGANLRGANLRGANLRGANLIDADLIGANLRGANLRGANLIGADLIDANLIGADLIDANLRGANLRGANLRGANLRGAKNIPFIPMACPETGAFIGWKKARDKNREFRIVKLEICEDARRSSATGRKCRCDKAKVLEIQTLDGKKLKEKTAYSDRDSDFIYKVGKVVEEPTFNEDRFEECASGIHFFINRQEAVEY